MAQKVTVQLFDDLDGSEAENTVQFGLDGVQYEIDLSTDNAKRLREELEPYIEKSRRVGGRLRRSAAPTTGPKKVARVDREQTAAIRQWANNNGYEVSDRGRIAANVMTAFQEAHA